MRTFKVTLTEEELRVVLSYNCNCHYGDKATTERSLRIHELTKKLSKSVEDKVEQTPTITEEQAKNDTPAVDGWG